MDTLLTFNEFQLQDGEPRILMYVFLRIFRRDEPPDGIFSKLGGRVSQPHEQPRLSSQARFVTKRDSGGI